MHRLLCCVALFAFLLAACGPGVASAPAQAPLPAATSTPAPRTLTVFAAASLTGAFKQIGDSFEAAHPGVTVTLNFAGSQTLRTQIEQGAQADVFASANTKEMHTLISDGDVDPSAPKVFVNNKLVVILPSNNPASLQTLQDLARPGLRLVLAAEDVPVGNYARQALDLMGTKYGSGYKDKVLANVVSNEEDVKLVVAKVQLGEADAGIVYTSDAVAAPELKSIQIPADSNVIANYPIAALKKSSNADLAEAFIAYVLSANGQAVLQKWGFASAN